MSLLSSSIGNIVLFFKSGKKSENTRDNEMREQIIANLYSGGLEPYFVDETHGPKWTELFQKFDAAMRLVGEPVSFDKIKMERMGGRHHNYDFVVHYLSGEIAVKTAMLEFKHNAKSLESLPQILEISDKDMFQKYELGPMSYSKYFYGHGLNQYLECDAELAGTPIPDEDTYLKHVHDIQYKHPFFNQLHQHKNREKTRKARITNESMKTFIQLYGGEFHFDKIVNKIRECQQDKIFLLWDFVNFHIDKIDIPSVESVIENVVVDGFCLLVAIKNFKYNIKFRLNWGNNLGIANPRWKISVVLHSFK